MTSRLRIPTLAVAALSFGLNIAIIGTAARTLHIYQDQRYQNAYFLPVWGSHFDMRGLHALIGTSSVIVVLNAILVLALLVSALPANILTLASSSLSTIVSIVAIAFSAVLNNRAPAKETLQSWTCMWRTLSSENVPREFDTLCNETRFAFYTTVPSLILQVLLLGLAVYATTSRGPSTQRGVRLDEEKDHELTKVRQQSFDTKADSLRSIPTSVRIMAGKQ